MKQIHKRSTWWNLSIQNNKVRSNQKTARLAGALYLLMGVTAFYGIMYVPKRILVKDDISATLQNILTNELLFRTGIASHLISQLAFIFLVFVLYRLLKNVNRQHAHLMVALVIVQVPIAFFSELCRFSSLMILKGDVLGTSTPERLQELTMLFLKFHGYGISILEIFMGLWLIPFGQLVYRSGFIPRIAGVLLIIAGISYTVDSFTFILAPRFSVFTKLPALTFSAIGEISIILWLLIKGIKDNKTAPG